VHIIMIEHKDSILYVVVCTTVAKYRDVSSCEQFAHKTHKTTFPFKKLEHDV
jgi:hypothetical protein